MRLKIKQKQNEADAQLVGTDLDADISHCVILNLSLISVRVHISIV
jgi:hypothetical protein